MKKILSTTCTLLLFTAFVCAQKPGGIKVPSKMPTSKNTTILSETDIANGLKEALTKGAKMAADTLYKKDGYYGNSLVRIPYPPELARMESTLRNMGLGKEIDKFVLSLNRSAENAAIESIPIFTNAITKMSFTDAKSILQGSDSAATSYLRKNTYDSLVRVFTPYISKALDNNLVASQWSYLASTYNKLPTTRTKVSTDIVAFTTGRALKGLFIKVAEEEKKIRVDANERTSDLLKKVFGSKSK